MSSIKNRRKIVQFSPVRSGSTLVANILRDLFPERTVRKAHDIRSLSRKMHLHLIKFPVVSTYRYPLDIIASELKVNNTSPTAIEIERACQFLDHNGLAELKKILNMKNVLLLKYEDFYGNLDFLFDSFESFFDITIDEQTRGKLKNDYSIDNIKKITDKLSPEAFIDINHKDSTGSDGVFHGRHISESKGKPGSYKLFFNEEQIEWLRYKFSDFIEDFGYYDNEI
ncbi:hypothetical protein N9351_05420 [Candidatus Thioglobus sp.]|nr:hypothetical protein [Candidatus Thioglobus sp.]